MMTVQLIENLSFPDYCQLPGINPSAIKKAFTPAHLDAYLRGEMDGNDTDDRRFGRAIHCGVLEGRVLSYRFPISTPCAMPLKSGKRKDEPCGASSTWLRSETGFWYCGTHAPEGCEQPVDYMTTGEKLRLEKMIAKLKGSLAGEHLRQGPHMAEVAIQWDRNGVLCKTKLDWLQETADAWLITDLKKSLVCEADLESCQWKSWRARYDIAAQMNVEAVEAYAASVGKVKPVKFSLLFQEDSPPFEPLLIPATDNDLLVAKRTIDARLQMYELAKQAGQMFGYQWLPEHIKAGVLPDRKIEEILFPDDIEGDEEPALVTQEGEVAF